jgi:hypothetical protein
MKWKRCCPRAPARCPKLPGWAPAARCCPPGAAHEDFHHSCITCCLSACPTTHPSSLLHTTQQPAKKERRGSPAAGPGCCRRNAAMLSCWGGCRPACRCPRRPAARPGQPRRRPAQQLPTTAAAPAAAAAAAAKGGPAAAAARMCLAGCMALAKLCPSCCCPGQARCAAPAAQQPEQAPRGLRMPPLSWELPASPLLAKGPAAAAGGVPAQSVQQGHYFWSDDCAVQVRCRWKGAHPARWPVLRAPAGKAQQHIRSGKGDVKRRQPAKEALPMSSCKLMVKNDQLLCCGRPSPRPWAAPPLLQGLQQSPAAQPAPLLPPQRAAPAGPAPLTAGQRPAAAAAAAWLQRPLLPPAMLPRWP